MVSNWFSKRKRGELVVVLVVLAGIGLAICLGVRHTYLRQFAPLDKRLGTRAHDPKELLKVLQWKCSSGKSLNPYGLDDREFNDVQHLALVRLIELQETHFHNSLPSVTDECSGKMGQESWVVGSTPSGNFLVVGSPALNPYMKDDDSNLYWYVELLEFTPEGRLVMRCCNTEEQEQKLLGRTLNTSKKSNVAETIPTP